MHTPRTDTVIGHTGRAYDCATLRKLDRHLDTLSDGVARALAVGDLVLARKYRAEQDLLLDRRRYLDLTKESP
jgi:hypothetical protein